MEESRDKLVAASLAVRRGLITMDQALAIIQDPKADLASFLLSIKDAKGDGALTNMAETVAQTRVLLSNPADAEAQLETLGLTPPQRAVLKDAIEGKPVANPETLLLIAAPTEAKAQELGTGDFSSSGPGGGTVRLARSPTSLIDPKRYSIKSEFARGGMGRILLARDNVVGREVAIKELLPEFRPTGATRPAPEEAGSASSTTAARERFLREAKITGQLEHPNIVPVYEIGHYADGTSYYTMKFVRGETMYARLKRIQTDLALTREQKFAQRLKLLDAFVDVCHAVAYAHSKGVIHRDLKPHNIMLGDFGDTVLLDWGIARVHGVDDTAGKRLARNAASISDSLRETDSAQLTQDGSVFGTPHYMPPEQARGDVAAVDEQSDVYALGAILYEILTGAPPYEGPRAGLIIQQVLAGPPPPANRREALSPPELTALCERALASAKSERIKTALDLAKEVQAFRDGRTLSVYQYSSLELVRRFVNRNKAPVAFAAVALFLVVAAGVYAYAGVRHERNEAEASAREARDALALANDALDAVNRERKAREELRRQQQETERKRLQERRQDIRQRMETIENMRIGPTLAEMNRKLARYDDLSSSRVNFEVPAADLEDNRLLLSSLLGYISSQRGLLDLIDVPMEQRELLGDIGVSLEEIATRHDDACFAAARLAAYNGDFALATLLLSEAHDSGARRQNETARVNATRTTLLAGQKRAIEAALTDVRSDIRREGRAPEAPDLRTYIRRLSNFRDSQTVALLSSALDLFITRSRNNVSRFTRVEKDEVYLICGVLSRLELAHETVPVLVAFMDVVRDPELLVAVVNALSGTRSALAFEPVAGLLTYRFNYVWDSTFREFTQLPVSGPAANPDNARAHLLRAVARRARGDNDGAVADCTAGMRLDSANALLPINRAFARAARADYDGAILDFSAAIKLGSPHTARALVARGDVYSRKGELEAALADYARAITLDPLNPTPLIQRALARRDHADPAGAVADLTSAIALQDDRAGPYLHRGQCLEMLGRNDDALADYSRAIELAPDDTEGYTLRGILRRNLAYNSLADKDLTEAVVRDPNNARAYSWRAQARYGIGNLVGGVNDCTRAVELDPGDWMAYYYRGITYLAIGGNDEQTRHQRQLAVADFKSALAINSKDFRSHVLLAQTLEQLGDFDAARQAYVAALAVNPFGAYQLMPLPPRRIERAIAALDGRTLLERQASSPRERWLKAIAHASRAIFEGPATSAAMPSERDIADLRVALRELAAAEPELDRFSDAGWRQLQAAYDAAVFTAQALHSRGFCADAKEVYETLFARLRPQTSADLYNAACACARLAAQLEYGAVRRLGKDDADRARLEAAANSHDAETLPQAWGRETTLAVAYLERAAQAGFTNAGHAEKDRDLTTLRELASFKDLMTRIREGKIVAVSCRLVVISSVQPGRQADKLGLRPDDVIHKIGDKPVSSLEDLRAALAAVPDGANYRLTVRRYKLDADGALVPQLDEHGRYVRDANGRPQWSFEQLVVEPRKGLLGIGPGSGEVAPPPDKK